MVKCTVHAEREQTPHKWGLRVGYMLMTRKSARVLSGFVFLLLVSMTVSVNEIWVSAVPLSPYIMVVPEKTLDPAIVPGKNYTISVYTDYTGSDVAAWDLSLTFNPSVFQMGFDTTDTWIGDGVAVTFTASKVPVVEFSEKVYVDQILMTRFVNYTMFYGTGELIFTTAPSLGAEIKAEYTWTGVVNGNLITAEKYSGAVFIPGTFDNAVGKLSMAGAFFDYPPPPPDPPTTSGPGTFANITFRVVGYGSSNITLGQETKLWGPAQPPLYLFAYKIIDAAQPPGRTEIPYGSDHIGHGYFENINDVAITNLVTPTTAILGDLVAINVTIANKGGAAATYTIPVYANTTLIGIKQTTTYQRER